MAILISSDINGYKATYFGLIPKGWDKVRLGDIFEPFDVKIKNLKYDKSEIPVLSMTRSDGLILQSEKFDKRVASRDLSNYKVVKQGQLVYGFPIDEGVIAIQHRYPIGAVSPAYQVWNPVREVDLAFIDQLLKTDMLIRVYRMFSSNVVERRRSISKRDFVEIQIPLPPLAEQRAIAHVLNSVRQSIEATERVIAAAQELKRSLMKYLFTYGPVPVDQADQVPLKETEFGEVPEGWGIQPLDQVAYVQTGAAKGRKLGNSPAIEVPYLRVANVQDGFLDLSEIKSIKIKKSELERFKLQKGDVVLTEGGDFDKLGRGFIWDGQIPDCIHQNHIFAVRPEPERMTPEFLAFEVQSNYGKAYFLKVAHRTTNLASINSTKLKALPTLIPPKEDQAKITSALTSTDSKSEIENQQKQALELLFKYLLHHLMTGKIRVNNLKLSRTEEGTS